MVEIVDSVPFQITLFDLVEKDGRLKFMLVLKMWVVWEFVFER